MNKHTIIFAVVILMVAAGFLFLLTIIGETYISVGQIIVMLLGMAVFGLVLTERGA